MAVLFLRLKLTLEKILVDMGNFWCVGLQYILVVQYNMLCMAIVDTETEPFMLSPDVFLWASEQIVNVKSPHMINESMEEKETRVVQACFQYNVSHCPPGKNVGVCYLLMIYPFSFRGRIVASL